jgi:hypothetical protein
MRRSIPTAVRTLVAAALVAAAALSCPSPIDDELLLVVEDKLAPDLVITAPAPNSYYHGTVTVAGTLADSSRLDGDGAGRLASLSFAVTDAALLGFTVTFDPAGNATVTNGSVAFAWDPSTGDFSFPMLTDTLDGYRILSLVASDVKGNERRAELTLVEYPLGPDLVITAPADFSFYDMIVPISGTVTDTPADATTDEVRKIEVQVNANQPHTLDLAAMSPDPDGIYRSSTLSFDPASGAFADSYDSSSDSGTLYVKVSAWNAGNASMTTVQMRFNGTGPAVAFDSPAGGHNPPYYSSEVTPSIIIDGTVDTANLATMRYKVIQNPGLPLGAFFSPNMSTGAFSFNFSTATLAGNLSVEVYAKDLRGIESLVDLPIYDDTVPPGVPEVSGPPTPTNDSTPQWTWDTPAEMADYQYSTVGASGPWTVTTDTSWEPGAPLADGPHTLWVRARDSLGNPSAPDSYGLTVDTNPPSAPTVTGPATPTNDTTPTWSWNTPAGTVEFRYSLTSTTGPWTTTTATSYTPTLAEGSYTLWVQGRDLAGNWSSSDSADVDVDLTPPAAPSVTGPPTPTNDTTPTWSWTTPADTVEFRRSMTSTTGPWTTTVATSYTPTLGEGSHTLWVQGRDAAGNWSSSDSATVVIDLTPPSAPSVTGPPTPTNDTTPTWSWNTPAGTVEFRYSLVSTTGPWDTPTTATSYTPTLGAGTHTLWVQGRDAAGNWSSSDSATVVIDLTPPSAPSVTGPTTPTNDTTPTWSWNTPAGTVEFRYSLSSTTGPWTTTTATSYTPTLGEGSYTLWVQGRDAAGNWSSSDSASVDIDLTPPANPAVTGTPSPTTDTTPTWTWDIPADATGFQRKLDSDDWVTTGSTSWTASPPFSSGETHTLEVQARDAVGNWSGSGSYTIQIVDP